MSAVELVLWDPQDRSALEDLYAAVDQSLCLVQLPVPLPDHATEQYLQGVRSGEMQGSAFLCHAIRKDGCTIGKIEVTRGDDMVAELDIVIRRDECGKGAGKEAVQKLIGILARRQWCRAVSAYADRNNAAIAAVLEACGFQRQRAFRADVLIPDGGLYRMAEKEGMEYIRMISLRDREL